MRKASGFTIIELVVVITILGILAAVALPRFFDLQTEARNAAVQGVAGAVASGAAMNYAAHLANPALAVTVNACTSANLQTVLVGNAWPDANVTVAAGGTPLDGTTATGAAGQCVFAHSGGGTPVTANIIAKQP